MTIIGDLYSVAERAKVQGYIASVWAAASVVGPALGGVLVDFVSWRWIFFVNVPIGLAAAWVLARRFDEQVDPRAAHRIDYAGAVLLTIGGTALLLGLLEGGVDLGLVVVHQHRDPRLGRRAAGGVRSGRASRRRADPAAVDLPGPRPQRRQRLGAAGRRRDDGTVDVRPALRAGRARHVRAHGRLRAGRDDDGLADLGHVGRPALPEHRLPPDDADRRRVRHRRQRPPAHGRPGQPGAPARRGLLRGRRRPRVRGVTGRGRGAVVGRTGPAAAS